jgi:hypothetical protein
MNERFRISGFDAEALEIQAKAPSENGLLSDETYEMFPTSVVPLEDPNVLYIEIEGGSIVGELNVNTDDIPTAIIDHVSVQTGRNQGKGTYLLETFGREVALRGVKRLDSVLSNPVAMRSFIRIFGADKLEATGEHASLTKADPDTYAQELVEKTNEAISIRVNLEDTEVLDRLFKK